MVDIEFDLVEDNVNIRHSGRVILQVYAKGFVKTSNKEMLQLSSVQFQDFNIATLGTLLPVRRNSGRVGWRSTWRQA